MTAKKDMTGHIVGRLTVLREAGYKPNGKSNPVIAWLCKCACGKEVVVGGNALRKGVKSCGCDRGAEKRTVHGHSLKHQKSREYQAWQAMKVRCCCEGQKAWHRYGGRGITVCERWSESFEHFLSDMGRQPGPGYTLDRIDTNGNYEPGNCRWATRKEQSRNKTNNFWITAHGQTMLLKEWSRATGIDRTTIKKRLKRGMSPEQALAQAAGARR